MGQAPLAVETPDLPRLRVVHDSEPDSWLGQHPEVTILLDKLRHGDESAAEQLFPMVYDELRKVAGSFMRAERNNHTLEATALVHEAYLRLCHPANGIHCRDRSHFLSIAARAMRQILVNHAKSRNALKRGGTGSAVALDHIVLAIEERSIDLIALDEALSKLASIDAVQSRIVELRFFAGMSVAETADILGVSTSTIDRESFIAKAWLHREFGRAKTMTLTGTRHSKKEVRA